MDILTIAAAKKSGGSGGDVTKHYVDEHLALKADKTETAEYPIASTTTGINPTITNSADGYVQGLKVYGRSRTSKNLFDKSKVVDRDKRLSYSNGNVYQNSTTYGDSVSPYIGVVSGATYIISGSAGGTCHQYTENQESVGSGSYYGEGITTVINPNAKYLRFDYLTADEDNMQLELGSEPTAYEPYGIISIGDSGSLTITTANSDNTESSTATVTTGIPLYSAGDVKDELNEKRGVIVKRCEKTTEQGEEVIVPLATPVEIPLTASELAQLRNLRTFENTTNITITDDPTVDVGYLLDTDNGKAIGHLITTFSEMVLFETDLDTGAQITLNATITLSQPFTNFDEIVIEWGFKSNDYYEVFSNSFRSEYLSQMKRYRENHSSTQVEINLNYFNGGIYTCFIPTADDKLYITTIGGGASRYITKIIGRKYNAA